MEPDFSGYATKAGLQCSDGRTIMPGAFKHQDKAKVPLVWQHGHSDPENVLGHAILENRDDGVYAYGYFNNSEKAVHTRSLIQHGDITMLSIWANELVERASKVLHGAIREVSLVLSGANPGALIENVTIRHSDGEDMTLDDEVIIYTGLELEHSDTTTDTKEDDSSDIEHAGLAASDNETIQDVYDSMTDKQKEVLHFMLGQALETKQTDMMQQSNLEEDDTTNDNTEEENTEETEETDTHEDQKGTDEMKHNVFETKDTNPTANSLSHADIAGIIADATKTGSLKEAVENYAISHGIEDIDTLFPDAVALDRVPEFLKRRSEWVAKVLGASRKSPFSRIKTLSADITMEEARAKGYVTGAMKKEEFFPVAKRVTTPTTVYKKQKLDRDDMVDITDFDVVAWLKAEMRLMLDEEIARAILVGDGRDVAHEDKINEGNIRPIAKDHELYATVVNVNLGDANSSIAELTDAIILNRHKYKGSGLPTMFTTETVIAQFLLLKDTLGRRIYKTLEEVATELRVSEIVAVEVMEEDLSIVAILVNMDDYVVGASAGGTITMFDDFDIDYNQYKYLIETRMCGCLAKLKSAIVIKKVAGTDVLVSPNMPTFNEATGVLSIVNQTGVVYKNGATVVNAAGSPYAAIPAGTSITIDATPAAGYYFATSDNDSWTFTRNP
jgi:HK97 family phage prohead protease